MINDKDALEFVDCCVFKTFGQRLSDVEREVFLGSWAGQTYESMSSGRAFGYIERNVAPALWAKLTEALGPGQVLKRSLKGSVERAMNNRPRILISHRSLDPDRRLANLLHQKFKDCCYDSSILDVDTVAATQALGQSWSTQVETKLETCQYFLLLLSPQAAMSEMVIEELRRLSQRQNNLGDRPPLIFVIRIGDPQLVLNHDLRHYLSTGYQCQWQDQQDLDPIVQGLLSMIQHHQPSSNGDWIDSLKTDPFVPIQQESEMVIDRATAPIDVATPYPLPVAEPTLPKGQVRLASKFYITRDTQENQCYETITHPGALIRIKAPRQMGKTSLMARILHHSHEQGYRAIPISFQHADRQVFENLGELLKWLCRKVARKLHLSDRMDDFWLETYGSKDNCTTYFEEYLLSDIDSPLVLGFDEVDCVFQYPQIADDFFGLLRAWYEEASYGMDGSELWEKLRLVVVHSTEVYIPLDVNQSPFNVGLPIELTQFSPDQVLDLAHRYGLQWDSSQIQTLMTVIGGHPYLVRRALYEIVQSKINLDDLMKTAPTDAGIYGDHLRRQLWNLQQHPPLASAFSNVLNASTPMELPSDQMFKLHSLGLVQLKGNGVVPSFQLYRQYFGDRL